MAVHVKDIILRFYSEVLIFHLKETFLKIDHRVR